MQIRLSKSNISNSTKLPQVQKYGNHPSKPILESSYFLAYLCGKK